MIAIECRDLVDYATRNQAVVACKRLGGGKPYRCLDCMNWHRRVPSEAALLGEIAALKAERESLHDHHDTCIKDLYEILGVDGGDGEIRYKWAGLAARQLVRERDSLRERLEIAVAFIKTAPGRLPQEIQDIVYPAICESCGWRLKDHSVDSLCPMRRKGQAWPT